MRIQTEYSSYDFQAHKQRSQRRSFPQTALLWFQVLPDMLPALPGVSAALTGAPRLVVGAPSYSEGRQECPPRVWDSAEIDASGFTLHILSNTPWGFQWVKYILLMSTLTQNRMPREPDQSFRRWSWAIGCLIWQMMGFCESRYHDCGEDRPVLVFVGWANR
jgi:hypothetical protein